MKITRRDFVKLGGTTGAIVALGVPLRFPVSQFVPPAKPAGEGAVVSGAKGLLIDTTKCIGCRSCERACRKTYNLPEPDPKDKVKLDANNFTVVDFRPAPTKEDAKAVQPVKIQCMHCQNPACASVCPVGALHKTPEGPVVYDKDRCIGCRYCMVACPFDVPKYQWESSTPYVRKCEFCAQRQAQGQQPACSEACPTGALKFGLRADLVTEATARIQAAPDKYANYIYGKDEVGGTSVLYLARVPFDKLGFRMYFPNEAPPEKTEEVMTKLPAVVAGGLALLGGIAYFRKPPAVGGVKKVEEETYEERKLRKAA